jgi:signal recognition particle subunit SRP54
MFENLTDKLQRAFKTLRGQGTLTEENITEALREIRVALLEADVNLNVAQDLIEQIRVKAVGTEVLTALSPSEQVIKIVRDELIAMLGKDTARFKFAAHGHSHGRPARERQNHHRRQAGRLAQKGRSPAHAGLGGRLPSRRPRAAQSCRQVH